jgi:hypothetical protein
MKKGSVFRLAGAGTLNQKSFHATKKDNNLTKNLKG